MKAVNPNRGGLRTGSSGHSPPLPKGHPLVLGLAVLGPGSLPAQALAFPSSLPHGQQEGPPNNTLTHPRTPVVSSGCSALSAGWGWGVGLSPGCWSLQRRTLARERRLVERKKTKAQRQVSVQEVGLYILVTGREKRGIGATVQGPQEE